MFPNQEKRIKEYKDEMEELKETIAKLRVKLKAKKIEKVEESKEEPLPVSKRVRLTSSSKKTSNTLERQADLSVILCQRIKKRPYFTSTAITNSQPSPPTVNPI